MPKIQMRRDSAANWSSVNPVLLAGEWALETDTKKMKVGDGTTAYNSLEYFREEDNDWVKPADWPDIRSGALPNSVYFLVAHSVPTESEGTYSVATYPQFAVYAGISSSGTYDVFVDGIKVATTNSATATTIDWATLYNNGTLVGGYDVTHPSTLTTHVVRVTPTTSTEIINSIYTDLGTASTHLGTLWIHFTTSNYISIAFLAGRPNLSDSPVLECVSSCNNELLVTNVQCAFRYNSPNLKSLPLLAHDGSSNYNTLLDSAFTNAHNLKSIRLRNFNARGTEYAFQWCSSLQEIKSDTALPLSTFSFCRTSALKRLPPLKFQSYGVYSSDLSSLFNSCSSLGNTSLSLNDFSDTKRLTIGGSSSDPITGIKALTVCSEAPFDSTTSPQLDVSYTGLDRGALVNLFESMPYNVGYTVVGSPTIVDGVASGFSNNGYLNLGFIQSDSSEVELFTKITTPNTIAGAGIISTTSWNYSGFMVTSDKKLKIACFVLGGSGFSVISDAQLQANTTYYIKGKISKQTQTLYLGYSTNNIDWIEKTSSLTSFNSFDSTHEIHIGTNNNGIFGGSIDLKNTYIKITGVTWFNGANAVKQRVLDHTASNYGNLTISNNVASGFALDKYINLQKISSTPTSLSGKISFKCIDDFGGFITTYVIHNLRIGWTDSRVPAVRFNLNGESATKYLTTQMQLNTYYTIKFSMDTSSFTVSLCDENNQVLETNTWEGTITLPEIGHVPNIGHAGTSSYMSGNKLVYLDNTDLFINGTKVFSGTEPMTKTCSIVGTTGESALSAADKAIVLNKGWELTTNNNN